MPMHLPQETSPTLDDAQFLSAVIETQSDIAAMELDSNTMMRIIAERTQKLTGADGAVIEMVEDAVMVYRSACGIAQAHVGLRLSIYSSLSGLCVRTGLLQQCTDCETDSRIDQSSRRQIGIRSMVALPLPHNGQVVGVLKVISLRQDAFDYRSIAALRLMANLLAAALAHSSELEIKRNLLAERNVTLSALRDSQSQFRGLFEQAADAVFLVALDGHIVDVNELACRSLGYRRDQLLAMRISDIEITKLPFPVREDGSIAMEFPTTIHGVQRRRDGTTFPAEMRVGLIDIGGRKLMLGIARDISERRKTESALRDSEERFRSAFDHAAIGMALVSLDGRWLQVNRSLCRIVGYAEHDLLVTNFQSITFPDDLDADLAYVKQLIAGEIPHYQMVKRYIHRQGQTVWVLLSVSLLRDADGKPLYFISQIQDINQRKQAEDALRNSESEFRAIFDLAGVGTVHADLATGRFLRVNRKLCQMLGYSSDELQAMTFSQITHPDDEVASFEVAARITRDELSDYTTEKRYVRKDGGIIWITLNATVLRDSTGKPVGGVATIQDITERKRAQWLERDRRRVLEMVAKDMPLPDVLGQIAEALERQIDGSVSAIMVLEAGKVDVHGPDLPHAWMAALRQHSLATAATLSAGAWSDADTCGVTFIQSDDTWTSFRSVALNHNILACWAMPIQSTDGTPLGLLTIFTRQSRRPMPPEIETMDMAAKLAMICIDHHSTTSQLAHLVRHDRLTGLPNRLMFEDRVQQALSLAGRNGRGMALMVVDIDKFKTINDTLGHDAGDGLLQQFAVRLRAQLRETDTMARLGGDEFVVVLPEVTGRDQASIIAAKLIGALNEPLNVGRHRIAATCSIGIALFPGNGEDAVSLLKQADLALYRVKERGRNGFSF